MPGALLAADVDLFGRQVPEAASKAIRVAAILVVALVASRLLRALVRRVLLRSLPASGSRLRRGLRKATPSVLQRSADAALRAEARVRTIVSVARSVTTVVVWFAAAVAALDVLEISLAPFGVGAGIVGVALGFGAQNVVRDFLAGFFIVVEDQFGVGDVVDLGPDLKGTVERISLRATQLRDVNGVLWHVPNGQILRVGNKSQLWARAVLDVEVGYDTDLAEAGRILLREAVALAEDPAFADVVLEPPELWGAESFSLHGVVLRVAVKTEPAAQFRLLRALRARVVPALLTAGIELASAHPKPPTAADA